MRCNQKYSVPVSFDDLGKADSMLRALHNLQNLQTVMNDCFSRIISRVETEKNRLGTINQRVATAQLQVQAVQGSQTATTVYSTAKYPAPDELEYVKSLSHGLPCDLCQDSYDADLNRRYLPSENPAVLRKDHRELVDLYNSVNPDMTSFTHQLKSGLGKLPSSLSSVDSVLLFNQSETPYKQYNILNSLRGEDRELRNDVNQQKETLVDAPVSMRYGDEGLLARAYDVSFVPKPKEIQPLGFAPNLGNYIGQIATDVLFSP